MDNHEQKAADKQAPKGVEDVEQLLIPRYKIVADYPNRPMTMPVGHILTLDKYGAGKWWHEYTDDEPIHIEEGSTKYPVVLKPLHWSEEREEKDMPGWVKIIATGQVFKSYGFGTLGRAFIKIKEDNYRSNIPVNNLTPTTEQEYNEYINSKK